MIGSSGASLVTGAMICAPRTGCEFMIIRSSRVSRSGFSRTSSGTPILPTSWSRPPHSRASSSASLTRITRPMSTAISLTRWLCRAVIRIALVDGLGQGADRLREHVAHLDERAATPCESCTAAGRTAGWPTTESSRRSPSTNRVAPARGCCSTVTREVASDTGLNDWPVRVRADAGRDGHVETVEDAGTDDGRYEAPTSSHSLATESQRMTTELDDATDDGRERRRQRDLPRIRTKGSGRATSRISVVPIAATQPPTAGPPSDIAATIGAIATAWCDPEGAEPAARKPERQDDPESDAGEDLQLVGWQRRTASQESGRKR